MRISLLIKWQIKHLKTNANITHLTQESHTIALNWWKRFDPQMILPLLKKQSINHHKTKEFNDIFIMVKISPRIALSISIRWIYLEEACFGNRRILFFRSDNNSLIKDYLKKLLDLGNIFKGKLRHDLFCNNFYPLSQGNHWCFQLFMAIWFSFTLALALALDLRFYYTLGLSSTIFSAFQVLHQPFPLGLFAV